MKDSSILICNLNTDSQSNYTPRSDECLIPILVFCNICGPMTACYRRLLPISWIHYRRLIAYFFYLLQETIACFLDIFTLTNSAKSAKSAISQLKEGFNEIFSLCKMLRNVISFIYEKNYFCDWVPLKCLRPSTGLRFETCMLQIQRN